MTGPSTDVDSRKRKRESSADTDGEPQRCGSPAPPAERASAEPAAPEPPLKLGGAQEADSAAQGAFEEADMALEVDLPSELAADSGGAAVVAAELLPVEDGEELEQQLPMAVDVPPAADVQAEAGGVPAAAFVPAATCEAPRLPAWAAPPGSKSGHLEELAVPVPEQSAEQPAEASALQAPPAAEAAAPSPGPAAGEQSEHYRAVRADLAAVVVEPEDAGVSWDHFPNHLGEGTRARLLSVAALHLTHRAARDGSAQHTVGELPANSARVLLSAAPGCELYQERVVRALAGKLGVRVLVANAQMLRLEEDPREEAPDERPGGGPETWDQSDDEDPSPFMPKPKRDGSKSELLLGRPKLIPRRPGGPPDLTFLTLVPTPRGAPSGLVGAAAAAARAGAAAQRASASAALSASRLAQTAAAAAKTIAADKDAFEGSATSVREMIEAADQALKAASRVHAAAAAANPAGKAAAPAAEPGAAAGAGGKAEELAKGEEKADGAADAAAASGQELSAPPAAAMPAAGEHSAPDVPDAVPAAAPAPVPASGAADAQPAAGTKPGRQHQLRVGDRVAYLGQRHPGLVAVQERLAHLESALSCAETGGLQRNRDLLAQLVERRSAMAAHTERAPRVEVADAPPIGSRGRVMSVGENQVMVTFDEPLPQGAMGTDSRAGRSLLCSPDDLQAVEDKEDLLVTSLQALFDVASAEAARAPLVVFVQNLDRIMRSQGVDQLRRLEALMARLPRGCLFLGGHCSRALARPDAKREGGGPPSLSRLFGSLGDLGGGGGGDLALPDRFGRGPGRTQRRSLKGRWLSHLLPNQLELHPPNSDAHAAAWKKMVEADVAAQRERSNRLALQRAMARCHCVCDELHAVCVPDLQLTRLEVERVLAAAVAAQARAEAPPAPEGHAAVPSLCQEPEPCQAAEGRQTADVATEAATAKSAADAHAAAAEHNACMDAELLLPGRCRLRAADLAAGAEMVRAMRAEAAAQPERQLALKEVAGDQYEKQLLSEVIPPDEIPVSFDDIGALDGVKSTLHEVVILPLQRPELFTRGALTKPTKGLLLFGPPGTGKTMLAKAVASASGAHFINVNMSAITSKWLGEGERLVRAVFGLAHKLAPSVIFVDEIDSFLSRRGQSSNEHESLRKMKNEFMTHWDGLRTKASDRVLVLAASNRPMDLDDAAVRRMPRRIFVPLPDAANRERILQVILKDEALDAGFDFGEAAALSDGYSGSDLKNACIAAAYFPIRELLAAERVAAAAPREAGGAGAAAPREAGGAGAAADAARRPAALASAGARAAGGGAAGTAAEASRLRPITMGDFRAALRQVTASTHGDSATMNDLKRWNDQYGEGGSRSAERLSYYT